MTAAVLDRAAPPIRVLVVDDQSFMRIALRQIIEADGDMRVVGEARNGIEAVALAKDLRPDAITMDVEMPEMDGLEACSRIMREVAPRPAIIMVSAYTQKGADIALRALRLGAADFVSKSSLFSGTDLARIDAELRPKLRAWSRRTPEAYEPAAATPIMHVPKSAPDLVVIAVSTGGPQTLTALLRALPPIAAPIVIAQHMPEFFTASLAQMLSADTGHAVAEGSHREPLAQGSITLVPGGRDGIVALDPGGGYQLRLVQIASSVHPSADALFESAALIATHPIAIVLTGMGNDGTKGAAAIRRKGAPVLAQNPSSCIVGGMPEAAIDAGAVSEILPVEQIAMRLSTWSRAASRDGVARS